MKILDMLIKITNGDYIILFKDNENYYFINRNGDYLFNNHKNGVEFSEKEKDDFLNTIKNDFISVFDENFDKIFDEYKNTNVEILKEENPFLIKNGDLKYITGKKFENKKIKSLIINNKEEITENLLELEYLNNENKKYNKFYKGLILSNKIFLTGINIFNNVTEYLKKVNNLDVNSSIFDIATLSDKDYENVLKNQEFVVFDTETTGLVGEIIDLGAVIVKNNKIRMKNGDFIPFESAIENVENVDFFGYLIFPKPTIDSNGNKLYYIPKIITDITHIDLKLLYDNLDGKMPNKSSYDFVGCFSDFLKFVGKRPLVAHNLKFDIGRIKYHIGKLYINEVFKRIDHTELNNFLNTATIDTLKDAKKILKISDVENYKNSVLCNRYGLKANEKMLHRAYYDTFFTGYLFFGLLKEARALIKELDDIKK